MIDTSNLPAPGVEGSCIPHVEGVPLRADLRAVTESFATVDVLANRVNGRVELFVDSPVDFAPALANLQLEPEAAVALAQAIFAAVEDLDADAWRIAQEEG